MLHFDENTTEIICINDGSSDSTITVLNKYFGRIKIINVQHSGVSTARNIGLSAATAEWLWFVDSDDLVHENAFETIKNYWNDSSDILFFGAKIENNPNLEYKLDDIIPENETIVGADVFSKWITRYHSPFIWNSLYKREFITENKILFSEKLTVGEDMAFQMSVFSRAKAATMISQPIYIYRYLLCDSTMKEALKKSRIPYHIEVLEEVLKENSRLLNADQRNLLYKWSYSYVIKESFLLPEYLPALQKVWKKYQARYPFKGGKNIIKAAILKNSILCKLYVLYRNIKKTKKN